MGYKVLLYNCLRVVVGFLLLLHASCGILNYEEFLIGIEGSFSRTTFFDNAFLRNTAPLAPFEEFALGLFIILRLHSKKVLWLGLGLLTFFTLFLWSTGETYRMVFHIAISGALAYLIFLRNSNIHIEKQCQSIW